MALLFEKLTGLEHIPSIMKEKVFKKAFKKAELAAMPEKERAVYEHNLHDYWTYLATIETAENKGLAKGRAEGLAKGLTKGRAEGKAEGKAERDIEIARTMKEDGVDPSVIAKYTGLPLSDIERLE